MSKLDRRSFLKSTALISTSLLTPKFLQALPLNKQGANSKNIVIIQLSGGNDGLNTIVPYRNDLYYENRPSIALKDDDLLKIDSELAFHKSLSELAHLFDDGYMSIINNVGYPNPNRSHFRSMDIWQSASDAHEYINTGWIGRFLDNHCAGKDYPEIGALEVNEVLSPALKGENIKGMAVKRPETLYRTTQHPFLQSMAQADSEHDQADFLYKTFTRTVNSAEYIHEKAKTYRNTGNYPASKFAKELSTVAQLINSGLETKIYYVTLSGFDTHAMQKGPHSRLLKQYSEGISAFVNDLKLNNTFKDTLIMTFSEFGRRVKQNGSNGTDHGAANNLFVIGDQLKKQGFYNGEPDLKNLDNGDIRHEIDFRQVYATLMENWLEMDAKVVLGRPFKKLGFV